MHRFFNRMVAPMVTCATIMLPAISCAVSPNVMISEIFTRGTDVSGTPNANDWVELYNQSSEPVDMTGWSLQSAAVTSGAFKAAVFPVGSIIPAKGFFLVELRLQSTNGTDQPVADLKRSDFQLNPNGARLALCNSASLLSGPGIPAHVVDYLGYSSLANTYEGSGPAPQIATGIMDKSLQRIRNYVSPTDYTVWRDHDDNATDFVIEFKTRSNSESTTRTHVPVSLSGFSLE